MEFCNTYFPCGTVKLCHNRESFGIAVTVCKQHILRAYMGSRDVVFIWELDGLSGQLHALAVLLGKRLDAPHS